MYLKTRKSWPSNLERGLRDCPYKTDSFGIAIIREFLRDCLHGKGRVREPAG